MTLLRHLAAATAGLAVSLMPRTMRAWGEAMRQEVAAINHDGQAALFALGCLGCALRHRLSNQGNLLMQYCRDILHDPRRLAALCAVVATGLGMVYMAMAGAPTRYLAVNAGALLLGFLIVAIAARGRDTVRAGAVHLAFAALLLLTPVVALPVEGAARWIAVAGLYIQPSLIVLPAMLVGFARARQGASALSLVIAALALALQPDRAMAAAMALTLIFLALIRPERMVIVALSAALCSATATILKPDRLPAVPYVDRILYTAFDVHPLAGAAVLIGAALLIVPAIVGFLREPERRETYVAFGAVWLAIIGAAAAGNYPTPLVGYGGSAILGYALSLLCLPGAAHRAGGERTGGAGLQRPLDPDLRVSALSAL